MWGLIAAPDGFYCTCSRQLGRHWVCKLVAITVLHAAILLRESRLVLIRVVWYLPVNLVALLIVTLVHLPVVSVEV